MYTKSKIFIDRFADTLPIEDRVKNVESNGTIGKILAEQFADTVIINKGRT